MSNPYIFEEAYPNDRNDLGDYNSEEAYELGVDAGIDSVDKPICDAPHETGLCTAHQRGLDTPKTVEDFHPPSCEKYEVLRGIRPNHRRLTGNPCSCGYEKAINALRRADMEAAVGNDVGHDEFCMYQEKNNIPCDCGKFTINATKVQQRKCIEERLNG